MENIWPRSAEDCKWGFGDGSTPYCSMGYDGGAESVSNLCTSLWDDSYELNVKITEVDSIFSADDVSSLRFGPTDWPQFTTPDVTRYTVKKFIKEDAAEEAVDHDACVGFDLAIGFGIGVTEGPVTAGVAFSAGLKLEDCSVWKEVPGGYNLNFSVYHKDDPNYDLAYSLTSSWQKM